MKTAQFIRKLDGWNGDARLYRLDPPLEEWSVFATSLAHPNGNPAEIVARHEHVVVSAAVSLEGPETYIFVATADGEITDWCEQTGSLRGVLDHSLALQRAGYDISGVVPL